MHRAAIVGSGHARRSLGVDDWSAVSRAIRLCEAYKARNVGEACRKAHERARPRCQRSRVEPSGTWLPPHLRSASVHALRRLLATAKEVR
jgi:hypothetical protein